MVKYNGIIDFKSEDNIRQSNDSPSEQTKGDMYYEHAWSAYLSSGHTICAVIHRQSSEKKIAILYRQ